MHEAITLILFYSTTVQVALATVQEAIMYIVNSTTVQVVLATVQKPEMKNKKSSFSPIDKLSAILNLHLAP